MAIARGRPAERSIGELEVLTDLVDVGEVGLDITGAAIAGVAAHHQRARPWESSARDAGAIQGGDEQRREDLR